MDSNSFRLRLAELVGIFGSQAEFARAIGIDRSSVNRWLNGHAMPDINKLREICNKSGVSADYLLGLSNMKVTNQEDVESCDLVICIRRVSDLRESRNVYLRANKQLAVS